MIPFYRRAGKFRLAILRLNLSFLLERFLYGVNAVGFYDGEGVLNKDEGRGMCSWRFRGFLCDADMLHGMNDICM